MAQTVDGGYSWTAIFQAAATGSTLNALANYGTGLVAVGDNGEAVIKYPGVSTWTEMPITPSDRANYDMQAVQFATPSIGWAVGKAGKILNY